MLQSSSANKGFILVEMLVAVLILMIICLSILPFSTLMMTERRNVEILNHGNELLLNELQAYVNMEIPAIQPLIYSNNTLYMIEWKFEESLQKWKACISWEDNMNRRIERCGYRPK